MRYLIPVFLMVLSLSMRSQSCDLDTLTYKGMNYGSELYFTNPLIPGQGFSIQDVKVNGHNTYDELRSNTVAIHLGRTRAGYGDSVRIRVFYVQGYKPVFVNPGSLLPPDDFEITYARIRDDVLKWRTEGEPGYKPFIIQQYRWDRWIEVEEIPVQDSISYGSYKYEVKPHYGKNRFRIVKINGQGEKVVSRECRISEYSKEKVKIIYNDVKDMLVLSSKTLYEIYDSDWELVRKGYGRYIDVSDMSPGEYHINFGNRNGLFTVE